MINIKSILIYLLTTSTILFSCSKNTNQGSISSAELLENLLITHTLDLWYPKVLDKQNGGYYSNYAYNWEKESLQNKFLVTQSRHIWTLSKAYEFYPENDDFKKYAHHGFKFLKDHFWDKEHGSFYQLVDSTGQLPDGEYSSEKRAYGNAFAIYGLAAYYKISHDEEVLQLAIDGFRWLDDHARDAIHGGYFQFLYRDGTPILREVLKDGYNAGDKAMVGLKDYNSSIHLLEAFTELHHVWPNQIVKQRLKEMYEVVSETMYDPRGFLKLNFYPDWTEVEDEDIINASEAHHYYTRHVTFGHDVETAFLLIEAAEELGIDQTEILPKAKLFVDHALNTGWDNEKGGFYEKGKYIDGKMKILDQSKNWWAQAEGLNSLLLMHYLFPDDPMDYYKKFELQLDYINQYLIDHQNRGWYSWGVDFHPEVKTARKASIWKGTYHTSRSLMHCISMLKKE